MISVLFLSHTLFFSSLAVPSVQAQEKPDTHVNDAGATLSEPEKQQLENILLNLQLRGGINLTVITVKTTEGRDIYDYSFELARAWDIGLRTSSNKSLLLVVAVDDKLALTQPSKGVVKLIPEGSLGELGQRLRGSLNSGKVGAGLVSGIRQFVTDLAGRAGFSTEDLDQAPATVTQTAAESAPIKETVKATLNAEPTPRPESSASPLDKPTETTAIAKPVTLGTRKAAGPGNDEAEAEEVAIMQTHPFAVRVNELRTFLDTHPESKSKARATELLVSSRAALGDEKLKAGDIDGGIEQLMLALAEAPLDMSDQLFNGVVSQVPMNLYLRGEREQSAKAAQTIETKFGADPRRLLALSGFYLGIENGEEAARIAQLAVNLAPNMAAAHHALGLALHISLRLDSAAAEYKRALELDPKTPAARRSLADLNRAAGKTAEALALYREQLAAEPGDKGARAGLVLSLYELGQTEEGDKELAAALKDAPRNLTLLAGAAYWFAAHHDKRALELASRAADIEPRYTWGQIALSRSLIAQKSPQYAERSIRFARQYGRFPTLDYEFANTLAAMGLYDEASEALSHAFTLKGGLLETLLASRLPSQADNFIDLLAPERRASIFQATAADSADNARMLKGLLALTLATATNDPTIKADEESAVAAAREFVAGNDDMRPFRLLYAATHLLQRGIGLEAAREFADAAREGIDAALSLPFATIAVQAEELHDIRAQAIAAGGTPDIPDAPRNVLGNILRGRIEDLSGWALFNQDKTSAAIIRLRRSVGVLPEGTPSWRTAVWHLATALQQNGDNEEALGYYIKSYNAGLPDSVRRGTIEQLYKTINSSLEGLDERIGRAAPATATPTTVPASVNGTATGEPANAEPSDTLKASPTPGSTPTPEPSAARPSPTATTPVESQPSPLPSETPAASTPAPESPRSPDPTPSPSASPGPTPASDGRPRRVKPPKP